MKYVVKFDFMDGKVSKVDVHEDDIKGFMDCIGGGEVFFSRSRGAGLWVSVDKIRQFSIEHIDEFGNRIIGMSNE